MLVRGVFLVLYRVSCVGVCACFFFSSWKGKKSFTWCAIRFPCVSIGAGAAKRAWTRRGAVLDFSSAANERAECAGVGISRSVTPSDGGYRRNGEHTHTHTNTHTHTLKKPNADRIHNSHGEILRKTWAAVSIRFPIERVEGIPSKTQ